MSQKGRKHKDRVWYVGDINEETNDFLCWGNVEGVDPDTDFLLGAVKIDGKMVSKNLVKIPSYRAITIMKKHKENFGLEFNVFVRDSPGAIIVPFIGNRLPVTA